MRKFWWQPMGSSGGRYFGQGVLNAQPLAVIVLLLVGGSLAAADETRLHFVEVPPEESGLTHEINSDPQKYGALKYPWMSPPVDIDGDGHLDIIYYGHHGGTGPGEVSGEGGAAAVWLGRGDGTFAFDERGYHRRWMFGVRDPIWIDLTGDGAMDGIVTEWARNDGRVMRNDGSGHWQSTELRLRGTLIDTDGDGRFDGLWSGGVLRTMDPPLWKWGNEIPDEVTFTEVWDAEQTLSRLEPLRGKRSGWRDAFSVDLTGDNRNELIVQMRGEGGFYTSLLATFVGAIFRQERR